MTQEFSQLNQAYNSVTFDHQQQLMQLKQQHQSDLESLENQLCLKYNKANDQKL